MRTLSLMIAVSAVSVAACGGGAHTPSALPPGPASVPATAPGGMVLSAEQAAAVRAYYGNGATRGSGRNGGLPPGIARNLARGKPLPPGIAKRYLPAELTARLPALGSGLEYVVAAGKLLVIDGASQVVRDVLLESVFG